MFSWNKFTSGLHVAGYYDGPRPAFVWKMDFASGGVDHRHIRSPSDSAAEPISIEDNRICGAAMLGCQRAACFLTHRSAPQSSQNQVQSLGTSAGERAPTRGAARKLEQRGSRSVSNASTFLSRYTQDRRITAHMRIWIIALLSVGSVGAISTAAPAAAQSQISLACGITGSATAPANIVYDPFSPSGLSEVNIPLIIRRNRGLLTGRTDEVSFILVAPAGTPPINITYNGERVVYNEGATIGRPRALSSKDNGAGEAGEIRYNFGNLFASDLSSPLNLRVTVPPSTDLSSGEPILLDLLYICSGQGGMLSQPIAVREPGAVRINVNTVSALQAHYAGSPLDFGEIGDVTTAAVLAAPDRYTTPLANSLRVRSSGPFQVQVRSQNDFRLTYPGGNPANTTQSIRYSARLLGQEISSNASFGTKTCARAGIDGRAGILPLRATLKEGGVGKVPANNYGDIISITFTPIIAGGAPENCANM